MVSSLPRLEQQHQVERGLFFFQVPRLADAHRDREEQCGLAVAQLCWQARGPRPVAIFFFFALSLLGFDLGLGFGDELGFLFSFQFMFLSTRITRLRHSDTIVSASN
jgi:hypothetical protein